ncbi:MAG: sulfotransferase family protein [Planctomycetaceae bacterium]
MMMKMLEAGGVPVLCDSVRNSDSDNPNGYYEFEKVKQTGTDASWLDGASGYAVKMVYRLVYDLPVGRNYRVILMRRNVREILASQRKMLDNLQETSAVTDDRMAQLFDQEIAAFRHWLRAAAHIESVEVHYRDVLSGSDVPLCSVNRLLNGRLNIPAMATVVDPSLYRNRSATPAIDSVTPAGVRVA